LCTLIGVQIFNYYHVDLVIKSIEMENAEEEMNERMMFLLEADPEDIPAEPDWSLSLPLENSSGLKHSNNYQYDDIIHI
jgi:hypothetical protein